MKIKVTAAMLCDLCGGRFTYEACEAIETFYEEIGGDATPTIGDICFSFSEIPADWKNDWNEDNLLAMLDNGNVVIMN